MIRQGANVMNITDPGYLSDYVPDVGVLNGPYLLADYRDFAKILESGWLAGIDAELQAAGIRVVSYNNLFGARHVIADQPVRTPADSRAWVVAAVRVFPRADGGGGTFQAMGAGPRRCSGRRSTTPSRRTWWPRPKHPWARSGARSCTR